MRDFENMAGKSSDPEKFIGNPVNAFLVIKKLMKDLQKFVDTVNSFDKLKGTLTKFRIFI